MLNVSSSGIHNKTKHPTVLRSAKGSSTSTKHPIVLRVAEGSTSTKHPFGAWFHPLKTTPTWKPNGRTKRCFGVQWVRFQAPVGYGGFWGPGAAPTSNTFWVFRKPPKTPARPPFGPHTLWPSLSPPPVDCNAVDSHPLSHVSLCLPPAAVDAVLSVWTVRDGMQWTQDRNPQKLQRFFLSWIVQKASGRCLQGTISMDFFFFSLGTNDISWVQTDWELEPTTRRYFSSSCLEHWRIWSELLQSADWLPTPLLQDADEDETQVIGCYHDQNDGCQSAWFVHHRFSWSSSWPPFLGFFLGLNFVTISLDSFLGKKTIFGPISGGTPLGPLFLFSFFFFSRVLSFFLLFIFFYVFHFLFSFSPKKKFLLFFFLTFLSNIFLAGISIRLQLFPP